MDNRGLYEMLGRMNLESTASPGMVQKIRSTARRKINFSPQHRNGSNGYENKKYAIGRHESQHGHPLGKWVQWITAKHSTNGEHYNPLSGLTESAQPLEPTQEYNEENPYLEVSKQYGIPVGDVVEAFACFTYNGKNYFIKRKALAQLTPNPKDVRDENITRLLSKPSVKSNPFVKLRIVKEGNNVFVTLEDRLPQKTYVLPQETYVNEIFGSTNVREYEFNKTVAGLGRNLDVI